MTSPAPQTAFFIDNAPRGESLARILGLGEKAVDGPFRLYRQPGGALALWIVEHGADAAYSAARLAARRGAQLLLPISEATLTAAAYRDTELPLGALVPVGKVWDLVTLEPLLHLLPDSARDFPLSLEDHLPAKAFTSHGGDAPACGTTPRRIRNRHLGDALYRQRRIALLDLQMAGYAAAAADSQIEMRGVCFIVRRHGKNGFESESPLVLEKRFEDQVSELATRLPTRA